jgi:hypothetical protein
MVDRPADHEGTEHSGWLQKKGKVNRSFQRRWFVLWRDPMAQPVDPYELAYYDGPDAKGANGIITLEENTYTASLPKKLVRRGGAARGGAH